MIRKIIPLAVAFLIGLGGGAFILYVFYQWWQPPPASLVRQGGYTFINPVFFSADSEETKGYLPLQKKVQKYIDARISINKLAKASIYFRVPGAGRWMGINENAQYRPASLLKVPTMIAVLRLADTDPHILAKQITYDGTFDENSAQAIKPIKILERGQSYTVRDLLSRMILYSDNNATRLLHKNIDEKLFLKVYTDLGLPDPTSSDQIDFMSARLFTYFFRVLYNATYLDRTGSEQALELLGQVDFPIGLRAAVPEEVWIAQKFGETTIYDRDNTVLGRELHDCGIIYHPRMPYFLCVMTKGNSLTDLEGVISDISRIVYEEVDAGL